MGKVGKVLLESDQDHLVAYMRTCLLRVPQAPRTRGEEAQINALFRALLVLSGGSAHAHDDAPNEAFTATANADLVASVLDVTRTGDFGDIDRTGLSKTLSRSPAFDGTTLSGDRARAWTTQIMVQLSIGFRPGHLVRVLPKVMSSVLTQLVQDLPSPILSEFGVGQVTKFETYLSCSPIVRSGRLGLTEAQCACSQHGSSPGPTTEQRPVASDVGAHGN